MTLQRNPRDTVVGTVGDHLSIEREEGQFAIMNFQVTTFGIPAEINVEYTWSPDMTENPEIKSGMVVRIQGWLDGDGHEMKMESWEPAEGRRVSVLVCGGRKFSGWPAVQRVLDRISPDIIIHGAAAGADAMAGRYAQEYDIECREFPAEWKRYGRSAGYRRNQEMLDEGKPDLVVAFPGGPGTQNMVKISRHQGFDVNIIDHRGNPRHGDGAPVVEG